MSRRHLYVLASAALLCLGLFAVQAISGDEQEPTQADQRPTWANGEKGTLEAVAMHRIGNMIEVKVWINDENELGVSKRRPLNAHDNIEWDIVQGDGGLYEDPETGRILFKAKGWETLIVRPKMGSLVGEPVVIGIQTGPRAAKVSGFDEHGSDEHGSYGEHDGEHGGYDEHRGDEHAEPGFDAAGGGLCGHREGPRMFDEPVDVRSVVSASVIPVSKTERVVRYAHGDYYSFHPEVGTMRIQYNPDMTSEVRLTSLSTSGEPFFPARAEGDLFFIIETLKDGYRVANWEPMTINATVLHWPPFQTPVVNQEGVRFFSTERPEVEMHRIAYQELYLYPSRELEVEVDRFEIRKGQMIGEFTLKNLTKQAGDIRWFLIGDTNQPITPKEGLVHMKGGESARISYRAKVTPSAVPQFITVGAVSESGARLVGFKRINFHTSDWGAERLALNEVTSEKLDRHAVVAAAAASAP